ncbi:MAG: hypothetical protein JXR37_13830 [Kiritimatiellae bacterium]|nr:hypothetical protein [Kiritimatiellia bacterium]
MSRGRKTGSPGVIERIDEALQTVRGAAPGTLASYYVGTVPFVIGLLYFWTDMSRGAFAYPRCFAGSFALAGLFIWMKCWQTVFCARLRAELAHTPGPAWPLARVARVAAAQTAAQPLGLVVLPAALIVPVLFIPLYAFYQNLTVLGDGDPAHARGLLGRAWRRAFHDMKTHMVVVWLLSPWILAAGMLVAFGGVRLLLAAWPGYFPLRGFLWFLFGYALMMTFVLPFSPLGCMLAANIGACLALLPFLLRILLGVQTAFTISGWHWIFTSTFLLTVYAVAYLCLDPFVKAVYTLRSFHDDSLRSAEDLRVQLRVLGEQRRNALT